MHPEQEQPRPGGDPVRLGQRLVEHMRRGRLIAAPRTHLDRVYEKTGVRSQGALIRVLLSVAAPV